MSRSGKRVKVVFRECPTLDNWTSIFPKIRNVLYLLYMFEYKRCAAMRCISINSYQTLPDKSNVEKYGLTIF